MWYNPHTFNHATLILKNADYEIVSYKYTWIWICWGQITDLLKGNVYSYVLVLSHGHVLSVSSQNALNCIEVPEWNETPDLREEKWSS